MGNKTKFTEEEIKLMKEMDEVSAQAEANPEISNMRVPDSLWYELQRDIREYEEEKRAKEQEQRNQELIKLGLVYEHRRKYRKYYVLAATLVLTLALGITSFGGPEKIFNIISGYATGREQTYVDSKDGVEEITRIDEEIAYGEMEEKLGFCPVRLTYMPEGVAFLESTVYDELLGVNMYYGKADTAKIIYMIRPNYREGSWSKDVEDELLEAYEIELPRAVIQVKQYQVTDNSIKWLALYEYNDVRYSLMILDMEKNEVEKIIHGLYFGDGN